MTLLDALKEYKQYLIVEKGLSKNTIAAYIRDLVAFSNFIIERFDINQVAEIEKEHIRLYLKELDKTNSTNSISRKMISLRMFYIFLVKEKIVSTNLMSSFTLPKKEKKLPAVLSVAEMRELLESIETTDAVSARNRCLVELLYATGMRVSELLSIKLSDLNIKMGFVKVIGKGDKERLVPISDYVGDLLSCYINQYREKLNVYHDNLLFLNQHGNKLSRQEFYTILQMYVDYTFT